MGEAVEGMRRGSRAVPEHLDGNGEAKRLTWAIGENKRVPHGLRRKPRGVQVIAVDRGGSATSGMLCEVKSGRTSSAVLIANDTGVAVTAAIWIF